MAASLPPLFQLLSDKASFLQSRHAVLTQNVANADTPDYRPKDLVEPDFASALKAQPAAVAPVRLERSRPDHLAGLPTPATSARRQRLDGFEIAPAGNAVILEEQIRLLGSAARGYQLATSIYSKYVGLMRTAMGAGGR
jgi:flagellar basal-body rod protein FlgB